MENEAVDAEVLMAVQAGNFNIIRVHLMEIKDTIRFMALGNQFKDFLDTKLSESLDALYTLQNGV